MLSKNFPFKRETCASALADISTPAVVLFAIVSAAYGSEMYPDEPGEEPWDPVTLWHHLREDFKVEVSIEAENRLNAIRTAIETDLFYLDVEPSRWPLCTALWTMRYWVNRRTFPLWKS